MPLAQKRWLRFPDAEPMSTPDYPSFCDIDYSFKIASSRKELSQAFHLLYQEYRKAGYVTTKTSKTLFTKYHLLPESTVFIAKKENRIFSTATIVYDSPETGLPMDCLYAEELAKLRANQRKILEITSLASEKSLTGFHIAMNFTRLVFLYSIFQDVNDICIMVNPRHVAYYARYFPFTVFGEEKYYSKVDALAVGLRVDVDRVRDFFERSSLIYTIGHQFFTYYLSVKIAINYNIVESIYSPDTPTKPPKLFDAPTITRMLSKENPCFLEDLSPQFRKHLATCYPGLVL
ncbi:MAG: hypothetical protein EA399_11220 [Desulfovibrionales bacterium]|nr:MAG: hypothetical protein EA399_11220 [Desulfovibrionales bacterium]